MDRRLRLGVDFFHIILYFKKARIIYYKKVLTHSLLLCYIRLAMEAVFFLCLKKANWCIYTPAKKKKLEVEVVRVKITLACTECKQRNYNMTKDKKTHPDRMETKKYCKFCKSHTLHKETK